LNPEPGTDPLRPFLSNTPMAFVLSEKRKTISAIPGDILAAVYEYSI
jgi:hypothetical protein